MTISSYPTRAVTVFNFPEVETDSEFVYNYRVDGEEETPEAEAGFIDEETGLWKDLQGGTYGGYRAAELEEYLLPHFKTEQELLHFPRYVILSWTPSEAITSGHAELTSTSTSTSMDDIATYTAEILESVAGSPYVKGVGWASAAQNQSQSGTQDEQSVELGTGDAQTFLAFEESINNSVFFGLNLQPVGFTTNMFGLFAAYYNLAQLLTAGVAEEALTAYTDELGDLYDAAAAFIESWASGDMPSSTFPGSLDNERKALLLRAFTNYQSLGFFENITTAVGLFENIARLVDINASINSKVSLNVMSRAAEQDINVFGSTFDGLLGEASAIQTRANLLGPGVIDPGDVTIVSSGEWEPYQLFDMDTFPRDGTNPYDRAIPVGYVIDKFREETSGVARGSLVHFDRILIEGAEVASYVDPAVAYGQRYYYSVRTVFLTEFNAVNIAVDEFGTDEGQSVIARVLVASRGSALEVVDTVDETAPDPPDSIKFSYDPEQGGLLMFWEYPPTEGTDIGSWQIFKRSSIEEPYQLLQQIRWSSFLNKYEVVPSRYVEVTQIPKNFFVDKDFSTFSSGYYAVCSVDHHGFSSGYSTQYYVTYDYQNQRTNARKISKLGAPKPYPNFYIEEEPLIYHERSKILDTTKFDLFIDSMKDSGHKKLKLYFDPEYYYIEDNRAEELGGELIQTDVFESGLDFGVPRYKLTILNVDLQKSEIVDISIVDTT